MAIPLDLLDDLCTRFLLNVPAHELDTAEKAMFIVEQAHWYYEDFCRDANPSLPSLSLRAFAHALAAHCPDAFGAAFGNRGSGEGGGPSSSSSLIIHDVDAAMAHFNAFKAQVPTAGAALLDPTMTKVLMVKGYKKDASWGFPRGKLSRGETPAECAAREVLEETGIDISDLLLDGDEEGTNATPRIEINVNSQLTTLFVVAGAASEETPVAALVRGEIGDIAWHMLSDLPATREAGALTYRTATGAKHRFWRVWPYIKPLRRWVRAQQQQLRQQQQQQAQQQQQRGGGGGGGGKGTAKKKGTAATPAAAKRTKKSSGALEATAEAATAAATTTTPTPSKKKRRERSSRASQGARRAAAPAAAAEHLLVSSSSSSSSAAATASTSTTTSMAPGEKAWLDFRFDRAPILEALRG